MKALFSFLLLSLSAMNALAQKETFDLLSYTPIKGWKKATSNDYISFSAVDEAKGSFCSITIYRSGDGDTDSKINFDNSWQKMAAEQMGAGNPAMEAPSSENGWQLQSGSSAFNKGGLSGKATLVTATSGAKMINMVILMNSDDYAKQVSDFIRSINLKKAPALNAATSQQSSNTGNSPIVGIWLDNTLETSGYMNGMPMYTAGYTRKEYTFYANGTYRYLRKAWFTTVKNILFGYETGTWSVQGNQLIVVPQKGKSEEWSKATGGRTTEWGKLLKSENTRLTKTTYTFETKYYSGSQSTALELHFTEANDRELTSPNDADDHKAHYSSIDKSMIDLPPGLSLSNASPAAAVSSAMVNTVVSGKTFEGTTPEKFISGPMNRYNTGGFSTIQYRFNTNGTYRFISILASHYTDTKTLEYETGTYSINGNQLTIIPLKGQNEVWSKTGKTTNGNSDVTNRNINETWNKKIKTAARKLEKYTYSFSVGKNGDKNALLLQRSSRTEREGEGSTTYLNETMPANSAKLPPGL